MIDKNQRKQQYNSSSRIKPSNFQVGDQVSVRNFYKTSKFEPYFLPERFSVVDTLAGGKIILVQGARTGKFFRRHPNDLKIYEGKFPEEQADSITEEDLLQAWREAFASLDESSDDASDDRDEQPQLPMEQTLRRSERIRHQTPRNYNEDLVDDE